MRGEGSKRIRVKAMENEEGPDRSNVHYVKRHKRRVSHTRIVMVLLLICRYSDLHRSC